MTDQATAAMMEKAREIAANVIERQPDEGCLGHMAKTAASVRDGKFDDQTMVQIALAALASQAEIVGELVGALATARDYVHAEVAENGDDADRADLALIDTTLAKARGAGL